VRVPRSTKDIVAHLEDEFAATQVQNKGRLPGDVWIAQNPQMRHRIGSSIHCVLALQDIRGVSVNV